ncbi:EAL domain-containing protein [Acetobacterium sp.]|uniref:EAL domain-containing protein n=1 Tax=Acetobacterium sp. TaxID=1872094 RepID=UPI003593882A
MNWFAAIYFSCFMYYMITAIVTLTPPKKNGANWVFGMICLNLALWSMLLFMMILADSPELAAFYRRVMSICWSTLFTLTLYLVLFLSERRAFYDQLWKNLLLITPGVFCFFYYFLTPIGVDLMIPLDPGWAFAVPADRGFFWDSYFTLYYVSYTLMALAVTAYWNRTTLYTRERRQSTIIFLSFLSTLIFGGIADTLLPILGITTLPPLTVLLCLVCIIGLNFAITRYRMMSITPESIMMEVFMMMSDGLIITDGQGLIVTMNAGAEMILGYPAAQLRDHPIDELFAENAGFDCHAGAELKSNDMELIGKDQRLVPVLISCHTHYDQFANRIGTVFTFQDINELKRAEAALAQVNGELEEKVLKRTAELAQMNQLLKNKIAENVKNEEKIRKMVYEDALTKLSNRRFFYEYLEQHVTYALRYNKGFAVLFIDLDGFKLINDSLGHDRGDALLIRVAQILKKALRESDVLSRAGGDEFLILLHNTYLNDEVIQACEKILQRLELPIAMDSYNLHISASIGIACFPQHGYSSEALIKNADIAMYEAKEQGKGRFVFYDDSLKEDIDENMTLSNDLYAAIENNEFELFYQPQVDATSHQINGFEALIRWHHPERGLLAPAKFIALAEQTGLIIPIGEWVIRTAMAQQKKWEARMEKPLRMGVNLSTKQLKKNDFVDYVKRTLGEFDINPDYFELEITESIFMEDTTLMLDQLSQIKSMGMTIAIDDFGTEYSSLSYLKKLPLDRIKIPKTFIDGIGNNEKDEAIIVSTIVLAIKLGCSTIAEGVENEKQLQFLKQHGCQEIQGYYFYQPMRAAKIEHELLNAYKKTTGLICLPAHQVIATSRYYQ